jgi:hypothetical protein
MRDSPKEIIRILFAREGVLFMVGPPSDSADCAEKSAVFFLLEYSIYLFIFQFKIEVKKTTLSGIGNEAGGGVRKRGFSR